MKCVCTMNELLAISYRLPATGYEHELLHTLAGLHFTRVDVPLRVGGNHVEPVELAGPVAGAPDAAEDLPVLPVQDPDRVVLDVGDEHVALPGIGRESHPP